MEEEIKGLKRRVAGFMAALVLFTALFVGASYLVSVVMNNYFSELTTGEKFIPISGSPSAKTVVIDPGHGGEDGGSSSGEVLEKDLNLSVAEDVRCILALLGVESKMTRTEDTALYDLYGDLSDYTGKKKIYDLKNRVRFAEEEGDVYLGIHMNKFPDPRYGGLQVWYSPNNGASEDLARTVQSSARESIDPDNGREVKRATSAIYVLNRLEMPAVLVECGFLSNPEELSNLCDPSYRLRLACSVAIPVAEFALGDG